MKFYICPKISFSESRQSFEEQFELNWSQFFKDLGIQYSYLSSEFEKDSLTDIFKTAGTRILIPGGNDLSSKQDSPENKVRDSFENEILKKAIQFRTPVISICRGAQFLYQFFGGKIIPIAGHAGTRHDLNWTDNTYNLIKIKSVLSHHNYGLESTNIPNDIIPIARDHQTLIEAYKVKDLPMVGLMWHPERQTKNQDYYELFLSL